MASEAEGCGPPPFSRSAYFYWAAGRPDPNQILLVVVCCAAGAAVMRILAVRRGITGPMLQPAARTRTSEPLAE